MTDIAQKDESKDRRPVLVTGAHRSGTTWVGKMLAASGEITYISEPLNVLHRPGVFRAPVRHWYPYICEENEADYWPALQETLRFHYHGGAEIRAVRSLNDLLRMVRDWSAFAWGRAGQRRPLLKDPFAVFSAAWFARKPGCAVVIVVRHPAAFVSSVRRLGWKFPLDCLVQQPLLIRDWLEPFLPEMESVLQFPDDLIGQNSLLWRMIYHVVSQYRASFPEFHVVRHEDLSLDPENGYRILYAALGLTFTERSSRVILRSTREENPGETSARALYSVRLDSRANLSNWKRRLSREEITRIRRLTEDVATQYYSDEEWDRPPS